MKREPIIYAVLLLAALGMSYGTWTRQGRVSDGETAGVQIWDDDADRIVGVVYAKPNQTVRVERRVDSAGRDPSYLWAIVDTAEFVVAEDPGKRLLEMLAAPRALRDLGPADAEKRKTFGLDSATARLTVQFRERERELIVGGPVFATADRYALEPTRDRIYVLPAELVQPLDNALSLLPERRLHWFAPSRIGTVTVRSGERTRTMLRTSGDTYSAATWAPPEAPERADQTFANFIQRVEQLWVSRYAPRLDPATLTLVLRVDYVNERGRPLGFLELYRRPGQGETPEYYVRTELTRVPTRTYDGLAQGVERDLSQIFSENEGRRQTAQSAAGSVDRPAARPVVAGAGRAAGRAAQAS